MRNIYIALSDLPLNKTRTIVNLKCTENIKRRLLDLGLIEGTQITPLLVSPSNDPRAFEIRDTIIAIRKEDTSKIFVKY